MFDVYWQGEVVFDHKEKVMKLELKMKGKNKDSVKNLSGGERSYTTISLILAVWDKLRIPFYMLDEFDVFMVRTNL
jgi:chromosome segregation ATPase